jgi:hypothetical protein
MQMPSGDVITGEWSAGNLVPPSTTKDLTPESTEFDPERTEDTQPTPTTDDESN